MMSEISVLLIFILFVRELDIPVCWIFSSPVFPKFQNLGIRGIVEHFRETWPDSQRQKIHYSNQAPQKHRGAHSEGIDLEQFSGFTKM